MSRFDYVEYDEKSLEKQLAAKNACIQLEELITDLMPGRAMSLALTKLEEAYMWIGKAIRDGQIERNGGATLQERRGNE